MDEVFEVGLLQIVKRVTVLTVGEGEAGATQSEDFVSSLFRELVLVAV